MRKLFLAVVIGLFAASFALGREAQKVHVVVHAPADTPAADSVYVAGSLASVGEWKADGVKLARQADGTYAGDLDLEAGQTLEFKITRGSWGTVEKNADGSERANRSIVIDASTTQIEVTVERWAIAAPTTKLSTVVGTLKLHNIDSAVLKTSRTIRVWLPANYDDDASARFDVLYMHDGQNCFDRATSAFDKEWEVDETLTKLIADKTIEPLIVVGIDNGGQERSNEYTYMAEPNRGGGHGAAYAQFMLEEVKPFIEKTYRVKSGPAHTFMAGSSLGGLISLEIARRHPGIFGGLIVMSPALWWNGQQLTESIEKDAGGLAGTRVWIDMGTNESIDSGTGETPEVQNKRYVAEARRLDAALAAQHVDHRLTVDEGAQHNENAWAKRFPQAIVYLLKGE
jgi:predicted alpha/beta superfamily hydrolase